MTTTEIVGKQAADAFEFFKKLNVGNVVILTGGEYAAQDLRTFFECASAHDFQYAPDGLTPAQVVKYTLSRVLNHEAPSAGRVKFDFSVLSEIRENE